MWIREFLKYKSEAKLLKKESLEIYKTDILDFKKSIDIGLEEVTDEDIIKYIHILKKRYSPNSVKRKINSLKNFYKFLLKQKVIDSSPIANIVLEKAQNKIGEKLEIWELNTLIESCDDSFEGIRDRVVIELLAEVKTSINDILKIKISDLKLLKFRGFFEEGKSEQIFISERVGEILKNYLILREKEKKGGNSDYLFFGLSRQNFRARFITLGKKANLERKVTPNMLVNMGKDEIRRELEQDENQFYLELKRKYMEIRIGDD